MVLFVDWLVFKIIPGYIEGVGLAIVVLSVVGLSALDLITAKRRNRKVVMDNKERM